MIYMMQFLTSILFPGSSRVKDLEQQVEELRSNVETLTHENELLKKTAEDLALCIDQLATTVAMTISHVSAGQRDPVDEALDSLWSKDDDGPGYLN